MTTPLATCTCGHQQVSHQDNVGACQEPTHRCQCTIYLELCPRCSHAKTDHNTDIGQCSKTLKREQRPCGCTNYATTTV